MLHAFKEILDALDCPGGHILICICLGLMGIACLWTGHDVAGKPLLEFLPIAAYAMRGTAKANGGG